MSRRFDTMTSIFSPDGRLYQVEYAMEAISHGTGAVGILATNGVVLGAEKRTLTKLLEREQPSLPDLAGEKLYAIDEHIGCAAAGLVPDANSLIYTARRNALSHRFIYAEPIPVETEVIQLCNLKQEYTQYGGSRPFGVSFLFAGWDSARQFQLYHTDPSGNFSSWRANAVGANAAVAVAALKQEWTPTLTVEEALVLAAKVLTKTADVSAVTSDKLEFGTLTLVGDGAAQRPFFHILDAAETGRVIATAEERRKAEEEKAKAEAAARKAAAAASEA